MILPVPDSLGSSIVTAIGSVCVLEDGHNYAVFISL